MTFDSHTGLLILPEIGAFLSPSLQRAQFLQSPAYAEAQVLVQNEPWCIYGLPLIKLEGTELSLTFQFQGEHLHSLRLAHMAPQFGNGWKGRSEELELRRKAFHEEWLTKDLGVPLGRHAWGEVSSIHDAKAGMAFIMISYGGTAVGE